MLAGGADAHTRIWQANSLDGKSLVHMLQTQDQAMRDLLIKPVLEQGLGLKPLQVVRICTEAQKHGAKL